MFESIQTGAYINKRFYVPREVWWQAGAKFSSVQAKTQFLEGLLPVIAKVQEAFASNAALDLKADLDPLQIKLAKAGVSGIKAPTAVGAKPGYVKLGVFPVEWTHLYSRSVRIRSAAVVARTLRTF